MQRDCFCFVARQIGGFFLVVDDNAVMDQIRMGQTSPMEFGELIKSGYGHEPPDEVKEWVSKEYPGHSCF